MTMERKRVWFTVIVGDYDCTVKAIPVDGTPWYIHEVIGKPRGLTVSHRTGISVVRSGVLLTPCQAVRLVRALTDAPDLAIEDDSVIRMMRAKQPSTAILEWAREIYKRYNVALNHNP